jgi:hypothetical protein
MSESEREQYGTFAFVAQEDVEFLLGVIAQLRAGLEDAVWAADYLADQQAMADDGYVERLERAKAVLEEGAPAVPLSREEVFAL